MEQGFRPDGVPDGDFIQVREVAEDNEVMSVQIVTGIDAESEFLRQTRGLRVSVKGLFAGSLALLKRLSEGFGVELNAVGAAGLRETNGFLGRIDKHTDTNSKRPQLRNGVRDNLAVGSGGRRTPCSTLVRHGS